MLTKVRVRNFQSVRSADLDVDKLTVIVGASNSGKSALLRALRTLAYNAHSAGFVTTGQRTAYVEAQFDDDGAPMKVAIERGRGTSLYAVVEDGAIEKYPKAGTSTPELVSKKLGLAEVEGESLNFAFQFDRPFLLDETGTKVAKILGDLTNINIIFDAAREANRRRTSDAARLRVRTDDVTRLEARLLDFRDLPARKRSLTEATAALDRLEATEERGARLSALLDQVTIAGRILRELPELQDHAEGVAGMEAGAARLRRLRELVDAVRTAQDDEATAEEDVDRLTGEIDERDRELRAVLTEAGTCPTCGQKIVEDHLTHA